MEHLFDAPAGMPSEAPRRQLRLGNLPPLRHTLASYQRGDLERALARREELARQAGLAVEGRVWTTREGDRINLVDMTDEHLYNAWQMCLRSIAEAQVVNNPVREAYMRAWARAFAAERYRRDELENPSA